MNTIWIVLPILTLLMFDLGLTLRFEDFGRVFKNPWPVSYGTVRPSAAPSSSKSACRMPHRPLPLLRVRSFSPTKRWPFRRFYIL